VHKDLNEKDISFNLFYKVYRYLSAFEANDRDIDLL